MVRHHILVGLGLKRQNFRNRAIHFMMQNKKGSGMYNWRNGTVPSNQIQECHSNLECYPSQYHKCPSIGWCSESANFKN